MKTPLCTSRIYRTRTKSFLTEPNRPMRFVWPDQLVQGATLDVHRCPVASHHAPPQLMPKPVRNKVKQCCPLRKATAAPRLISLGTRLTVASSNSSSSSYGGFKGQQVAVAFCLTAINIIAVIIWSVFVYRHYLKDLFSWFWCCFVSRLQKNWVYVLCWAGTHLGVTHYVANGAFFLVIASLAKKT